MIARFVTESTDTHFHVPVVIFGKRNSSVPLRLLLDTGATNVVIPPWVVKYLHLRDRGPQKEILTATGPIVLGRTVIPRIQIRNTVLEAKHVDAWIGDNLLLGMSFIKSFKVTVEHGRKLVIASD